MQKGEISNRFNTLRNRTDGDSDKGIYWVSKRMGLIRNTIIIVGFIAFGVYMWFWYGKYSHKLKKPCQLAYEQQFAGQVVNTFLEANSKGTVTVQLLNGTDTVEYYTGWGGHLNTGQYIRKGYYLKKQANSFDLQVAKELNAIEAMELKAIEPECK